MKKSVVSVELVKLIAKSLGEINEKAVFVGGSIVPFYLPEEMMVAVRPTSDIDVVIEMVTSLERIYVERQLRSKGFMHDNSYGAPICRWKYKGVIVDILSTHEEVFGFRNRWYLDGARQSLQLNNNEMVFRILSAPYFIATKLEAFKSRGHEDYLGSHDMEDIISVFDMALENHLEDKIGALDLKVVKYLEVELEYLLSSQEFGDSIMGSVFDSVLAPDLSYLKLFS